ncbi:MAG: ImmA/IrrE family metallo-endopeptidase [Clostridia bacterium]|nr:ImmA/IrrE family metallo-endopeptidase [Clostridia bacterium]
MDYSKYKQSRNAAWQILIDYNIRSLPVKVSSICRDMGIKIIDYDRGNEMIKYCKLEERCQNNDGFTFENAIFYNNKCVIGRQRFTVAHELGHILLHNGNGEYNREPIAVDNPKEQEANVFASRLLAPACVLWGLNIATSEEIAQLCDISMQAAEFRLERLQRLYEREKQFIEKYNKSCFLQSPTEKQVYAQFQDFINSKL